MAQRDRGDETDFHDVAGANVMYYAIPVPPGKSTAAVLADVARERARQDAKWGEQNHDTGTWYEILGEEYGEVGSAGLDLKFKSQGPLIPVQLEDHYREELLHVAAVAVAAIECLDRKRAKREETIDRMPPREREAWRNIYAHAGDDEKARQQREAGR